MSKQATGEGGIILGSGAYWEHVNRSTVFGALMQNAAATNYQRTLRDTAARAAAAVEEVYTDLQKNAETLPDMPIENRNALAKQMRGLYDVCRMCGVSCSHGTECVTILNRAAFRSFSGAPADARAVQNAVAKIRNSPQFFQSEAVDIVRRAVNYGVSSAVGSSAQKAAFLKDVMQGKDADFLKAVLAAYSGGGQSAQTRSAASVIGGRDYRSRIESKVFLQTLTLAQGDNYERMLTDALRSIAVQLERDLTQNVREHNYINDDTVRILRAALAELRACGVSIGASEHKIEHLDWFVGGDAGKIRRLQQKLNELGVGERLTEDGVFGEKTLAASVAFVRKLDQGMVPALCWIDPLQRNTTGITIGKTKKAVSNNALILNEQIPFVHFDPPHPGQTTKIGGKKHPIDFNHINIEKIPNQNPTYNFLQNRFNHYKISDNAYRLLSDLKETGKIIRKGGRSLLVAGTVLDVLELLPNIIAEINDADKKLGSETWSTLGGISGSWAGAAAGAKIGAVLGAATGPAAPITVPVLSLVGGIAGSFAGDAFGRWVVDITELGE